MYTIDPITIAAFLCIAAAFICFGLHIATRRQR
jgi:hypothetical protein